MTFPKALHVSGSSIEQYHAENWEEIQADPRGLLLMFESPDPKAHYIMGLDATEGITGWSRATRTQGDDKTDNGVIEIFQPDAVKEKVWKTENGKKLPVIDPVTKSQRIIYRDLQVAEYAGPVDAVEIARIAYLLGNIYRGNADERCELIWEAWPGVGMLTTQELIRLGYGNLWMWQYIDSAVEDTNHPGWRSTETSQRLLWYRARRHLMSNQAIIQSKFLLEEYANAEIDMTKMRARAAYGYHDDRFQAANMCFWAGHGWTYEMESNEEEVTETPSMDFQRRAPGLDDYESFSEWRRNATADWD